MQNRKGGINQSQNYDTSLTEGESIGIGDLKPVVVAGGTLPSPKSATGKPINIPRY